jgi:uncharacterized damage-inducible protein DinB
LDNRHVMAEFLTISMHRMTDHYLPKLLAAIRAISHDELWRKEHGSDNSIGGIVLHILEHVRRFTLVYTSDVPPFSQGIEQHFPDLHLSPEELARRTEEHFTAWRSVMQRLIRQTAFSQDGVPATDMFRTYHLVEHISYHLGQVVDRARKTSGSAFHFVQNGINEKQLREIVDDSLSQLFTAVRKE